MSNMEFEDYTPGIPPPKRAQEVNTLAVDASPSFRAEASKEGDRTDAPSTKDA